MGIAQFIGAAATAGLLICLVWHTRARTPLTVLVLTLLSLTTIYLTTYGGDAVGSPMALPTSPENPRVPGESYPAASPDAGVPPLEPGCSDPKTCGDPRPNLLDGGLILH